MPRAIIWDSEDTQSGGSLLDTRNRMDAPPERLIDGMGHDVMMAQPQHFADTVSELADSM